MRRLYKYAAMSDGKLKTYVLCLIDTLFSALSTAIEGLYKSSCCKVSVFAYKGEYDTYRYLRTRKYVSQKYRHWHDMSVLKAFKKIRDHDYTNFVVSISVFSLITQLGKGFFGHEV